MTRRRHTALVETQKGDVMAITDSQSFSVALLPEVVACLALPLPAWGTASKYAFTRRDVDYSTVYMTVDMGIQVSMKVTVPSEIVDDFMDRRIRRFKIMHLHRALMITGVECRHSDFPMGYVGCQPV